jgi:hypothetical protein
MQITFSKIVMASIVMASAAIASNVAQAEATLKVPFSFTVAGKDCPAGIYTVARQNGSIVKLQSKDARKSFSWVIAPGDPSPYDTKVVLKFNDLGSNHELRTVQYGPDITSRLDKKDHRNEHVPVQSVEGQ